MRITFLGTGTSHGVPVIGCKCGVCCSTNPRNKRNRTSVCLETHGQKVLIDVAPEFRLQAVANHIQHIDVLLLTHAHADHIGGLDDVRIFSERSGKPFPIYGAAAPLALVRERFAYAFRTTQVGGGKPNLDLRTIAGSFQFQKIQIEPLPVWHGRLKVFGYRVGNFAYITDVSKIPEATYAKLEKLDILVLDALRQEPHATHFHLARALEEARRIGARKTYFTHLCHLLEHRKIQAELPKQVYLAYDGLRLALPE